ncbi:hypothetical protein ACFOLA_02180 [Salinicoccus hispanicus]|uniref:transposase family protein n=1 Tax=Salinicoccus hispanicus TaxID=157225 RepID=UPI001FE8398D|nr:transposase family protein [Salinicoccus hispanicus]
MKKMLRTLKTEVKLEVGEYHYINRQVGKTVVETVRAFAYANRKVSKRNYLKILTEALMKSLVLRDTYNSYKNTSTWLLILLMSGCLNRNMLKGATDVTEFALSVPGSRLYLPTVMDTYNSEIIS